MTYDDIKHELISLQHMHEVRPDDHRAIANALRVLADELDPPSVGTVNCTVCGSEIDVSGNCNCTFEMKLNDVR